MTISRLRADCKFASSTSRSTFSRCFAVQILVGDDFLNKTRIFNLGTTMKNITTTLAALTLTSTAAFAHVSLETPEAAQGSTYVGVLNIGHGCEGEPTLRLRVQIPEGVIAVKPVPKAGWELEIVTGEYATSYDYYGSTLTEGPKELIWSGSLEDAHFDQFAFRGKLTDGLEAGSTVYFPVIQECANGSHNWVNVPAEGQDSHDIEEPAPGLSIIEADLHAHH